MQSRFDEFASILEARLDLLAAEDEEKFLELCQSIGIQVNDSLGYQVQESRQENGREVLVYSLWAELFAHQFPASEGVLEVPFADVDGNGFCFVKEGKVFYLGESFFGKKFGVNVMAAEKEFLGVGQDGEPIHLKMIRGGLWFVYAEGNPQSPFEFESEMNARQFAGYLVRFRMEDRLNNELRG